MLNYCPLIINLYVCSIVYAIRGFPAIFLIFFFGTPFEPPRAGMIHIGFILFDEIIE